MHGKGTPGRCWLVLAPALVLPGVFAWGYFIGAGADREAQRWYAAGKGFLLVWPLLGTAFLRAGGGEGWSVRPRKAASLAAGLAAGGLVVLAMAAAWISPLGDSLRAGAEPIRGKLTQFGIGPRNYLAVAVAFSLVHSALEEYYWRWFGFGQLRRALAGWAPHLLAAAGFTVHHYVVLSVYFGLGTAAWMGTLVGVGGWLWSWMYERWGSLVGPWISHALVDLAIFWFGTRLMNLEL